MSEAPERIWFAPDEAETDEYGWAGVVSGKDRLFFETEPAHNPLDTDTVEYVRADRIEALEAERDALREGIFDALGRYQVTHIHAALRTAMSNFERRPRYTGEKR